MDKYYLYWLYEDWMDEPRQQGYVGVTKRLPTERLKEHLDRSEQITDEVKMKILAEGSKDEISNLEYVYRPYSYIGWNKSPGGLTGGRPEGIHTSGWAHSEKSRKARSKKLKGSGNPTAKSIVIEEKKFDCQKDAADYYGVSTSTICKFAKGQITLEQMKNVKVNRFNSETGSKAGKSTHSKRRTWWTNGIKNEYLKEGDSPPEGFWKGRVMKKRKKGRLSPPQLSGL